MTDQTSDTLKPNRRGERAIHITLIGSILISTLVWVGFLGWELGRLVGWV